MAYRISVMNIELSPRAASMPDIVMVFIGESGSGKSTCINYFANYFTNSSFDQQNRFTNMKILVPNSLFPQPNFLAGQQRHTERNVYDKSRSQTQDCTVYDFLYKGKNIKVVDTPGFNDTDVSKDDGNIQKILKQFSQLPFITAILITINGTNTRLSTSISSTLNELRSSLPDNVFDNLFFIFTNCTEDTRNFPEGLISDFNPSDERMFHMQNSLFSIKDLSALNNDKLVRRMEQSWQESIETMDDIMDTIYQASATSVQQFEEMRIKRERLTAYKEILILKEKSLLNIMHQIEIERDRLINAKKDQYSNQSYTEEKMITVIEIETKPFHSTLCIQHGDVKVCHENCGLTFEPKQNLDHFQWCAASDGNNNCRHCKCGMTTHLHSHKIPVEKRKKVEEIIQSKKAAYDVARRNVRTSNSRLIQLESAAAAFENDVNQLKRELIDTIHELKQICSHFNFLEEMKSTIEKLRKEAKIATNMRAKEEFNSTADAIEQLSTGLSNNTYHHNKYSFS